MSWVNISLEGWVGKTIKQVETDAVDLVRITFTDDSVRELWAKADMLNHPYICEDDFFWNWDCET